MSMLCLPRENGVIDGGLDIGLTIELRLYTLLDVFTCISTSENPLICQLRQYFELKSRIAEICLDLWSDDIIEKAGNEMSLQRQGTEPRAFFNLYNVQVPVITYTTGTV